MNQVDIAQIRLNSQQLAGTELKTVKEIVSWMGAMQAQDFPMAKWAVGVRLPGSTEQRVESAITRAEILRTHLLRPTWHFVAAEDIYWMLELTAPQIKSAQSARDRQLELTEAVYTKSNTILEKALRDGKQLAREELMATLNLAGIATDQNRAAHLLARAEIEKVICSGATRNGKVTYALLSDRVTKTKQLSRDEALAALARRYFTSRCPASLQDFDWWSGLPAREARQGLEMVKEAFIPETIDGRTYWLPSNFTIHQQITPAALFLPTYDEYILSYSDRSASIPPALDQYMKKISDRGVFRPIIIVKGQVVGIWKRIIQKGSIQVEIEIFSPAAQGMSDLLAEAAMSYGQFSGMGVEIKSP